MCFVTTHRTKIFILAFSNTKYKIPRCIDHLLLYFTNITNIIGSKTMFEKRIENKFLGLTLCSNHLKTN